MKKITLILISFLSFFASFAQASYFRVPVTSSQLDTQKRTHVLVTGRGNDLGTRPQQAAASKVRQILQAFPNDQILMLIPADRGASSAGTLRALGFENMTFVNEVLDAAKLMSELEKYTQIASFHIFGHSAIPEGLFLDGVGDRDIRWYPTDKQPARLVGHFTEDAIATLNGCNSGHTMAPMLSRVWKIPVSGALTGSHFETVYRDNQFYWAENDTKNQWLTTSAANLRIRMRPDNGHYHGHYGSYPQGLSFYKFFCSGLPEERCLKGMATSLLMTVSTLELGEKPSYEQYAQVAREWLCPTGSWNSDVQKNCMQTLQKIDVSQVQDKSAARFYTPFPGSSFQCTFQGCYPEVSCLSPVNTLNCAKKGYSTAGNQTTTFMDEYLNYLRGYRLLN
jgi:hypothetical protein